MSTRIWSVLIIPLINVVIFLIITNFSTIFKRILIPNKLRESKLFTYKDIDILGLFLFLATTFGWGRQVKFSEKISIKRRIGIYFLDYFYYFIIFIICLLIFGILSKLLLKVNQDLFIYKIIIINFTVFYTSLRISFMLLFINLIPLPPFNMFYIIFSILPSKIKKLFGNFEEYSPTIVALCLIPISPIYVQLRVQLDYILEQIFKFLK